MRLVYHSTITDVFERKLRKHQSGFGPDAVFTTDSAGWYIRIENEITLYCGTEKPAFEPGDQISIIIQRSQKNAHPH